MSNKYSARMAGLVILVQAFVVCGIGHSVPFAMASQREVQPAAQIDTSKWKTYHSENYGFDARYPDTWNVREAHGTLASVMFCKTPQPYLPACVQFAVQPHGNPGKLSIEKWVANELQKVKLSVPTVSTMIGGRAAIRMQVRESYELFVRLNATDILNIFYPSSKAQADEPVATILSSLKFGKMIDPGPSQESSK